MSTLQELEQMRKEIDAKIAEAKADEVQKKREHVRAKLDSLTEEQKQFLLSFVEHSRTSCSDSHVVNGLYSSSGGGWRCKKCMLIEVLRGEHGLTYDFVLEPYFDCIEDV